jgi:uncharacterized membrane protein
MSGETHAGEHGHAPVVAAKHRGLLGRLRNWFLTGIIVTAPIGLTLYLTMEFVGFVDDKVARLIPAPYHPNRLMPFDIPGVGLLVAVGGLTVIGFLTANFIGRTFLRLGERIVARMPVVSGVYSALKQLFETVLAQSSTSFRQVALIEFPKPGTWAIAFVTAEHKGEVQRRAGEDLIGLFVPTTPNPTSGYFVYVARKNVVMLSMSVDDAMKLVISGGVVPVPDKPAPKPPAKS